MCMFVGLYRDTKKEIQREIEIHIEGGEREEE